MTYQRQAATSVATISIKKVLSFLVFVACTTTLLAQSDKKSKKIPAIDKKVLESIEGKYQMTAKPGRYAIIKELEGKLIMEVVNEWRAELSENSKANFTIKNIKPNATIEIVKNNSKRVTKFIVYQKGLSEWQKI